jgi:hypothetical protein
MDDELTEVDSVPDGLIGIGGRPRSYLPSGRTLRLNVRLSKQERAEIDVAAAAIGMTPTGFAAEAALLAARRTPMTLDATAAQRETLARLQRQLFEARTAVNRFGNLVNQAVAALHATGQPPVEALAHATALCTRAVRNLDGLINGLHRRLR